MIWLVILVFLIVSFMFSGIEAGIMSVNRVRLRHRIKSGDKAAIKLDRLLSRPERMLVTVLLVTNLLNIFAIILSTLKLVHLMGRAGYVVSGVVWLPVYLLGLELFPKSLFRRFPYRALAAFAELLRITDLLLSPLLWIGARIHGLIIHDGDGAPGKLFVGREDFKYLTLESERAGKLTKVESEMINSVVDFRSVTARDVMIPMPGVQSISSGSSVEELLSVSMPRDIDRVPVLNDRGEVTGLADVYDVLLDRAPGGDVGSYQRRIVTVHPEEPAINVIQKLRASHSGLAVVVERGAGPLGILRQEDLISRLVKSAVS
ncbi:MAG: CNNM domain-containing protein [Verrucomicrobiota bacterium]